MNTNQKKYLRINSIIENFHSCIMLCGNSNDFKESVDIINKDIKNSNLRNFISMFLNSFANSSKFQDSIQLGDITNDEQAFSEGIYNTNLEVISN